MRPSGSAGDAASRLRHAALLALLTLVVLALFHPLLTRHALEVHDSLDTYLRADGYLRELGAGHVPPQLFADAVSGGGYARWAPPPGPCPWWSTRPPAAPGARGGARCST